ncbi:hypothetical protein HUSEC_26581, partial [Escherichia coli O104:H4 str. LB226692]
LNLLNNLKKNSIKGKSKGKEIKELNELIELLESKKKTLKLKSSGWELLA